MDKRNIGAAVSLAMAVVGGAVVGCGAGTPRGDTPEARAETDAEWTSALLRKLDPDLRARIRSEEARSEEARSERSRPVAVKVTFRRIPGDEELAELMLNRVGDQVVGRVQLATLRSIASRPDVERVEALRDVGY